MATGVKAVDDQHKELFRQVGLLLEAMTQGKGRQEVGKILDFLGDYVVRHFAEEERHMDRYHCPAAKANRRAHEQFISTFTALRKRFDQEGSTSALVLEVQSTLAGWLTNHIHKIDTQLLGCVQNAAPVAAGAT